MKVYTYKNCSTCRDAVKWLRATGVSFEEHPIRETPPSLAELRAMAEAHHGDLRPLFNTSGQDYRTLGLKDKLSEMSQDAALELLSQNGNLIKRPFVVDSTRSIFLTGFRQEIWARKLSSGKAETP
jgi:arsenate reductase